MAPHAAAGLTAAAAGRRFGRTIGGALAALAVVAAWRGRAPAAAATALVAALLLGGALVVPARLAPVERAWMRGAHALSRVTTPLVLALVYLCVVTPIGVLRRLAGRSALERPGDAPTYWVRRPADARRSDLRRQF